MLRLRSTLACQRSQWPRTGGSRSKQCGHSGLGQSTHRRSLTVSTMRRLASSSSSTRRTTCGANGVDAK